MAHVINFPSAPQRQTAGGLFAIIAKGFADYRLYLRTIAELKALSPRELRDLGLSAYTIRDIAYDAVYGR
ncbi:MAG: hypothetical protein DI556_12230 [Rhodovulum sulfidophilum]|uniref:YjiS-like domain-containing protein n=1 Tax=Rhodovulum sulfidophilum TaxID=35806 RepID=A0A2W5PWR7_RHOSU|nr:MAG: hypothetical protein DI556_12230 [Rhodovulum sulfidophilum]